MPHESWQDHALSRLTDTLAQDEAVRALIVIGSLAQTGAQTDEWSDLDLVLVVEEASLSRYWSAAIWLGCLGDTYTCRDSEDHGMFSTRLWYQDGRRVDVVVVAASTLPEFVQRPEGPLRYGYRVMFSRSPMPELAASADDESLEARPPDLAVLYNDFRFRAMLAVSKVARHDLLVALHLSLDLVRDCCVLAMMLRDREAGTRHHRRGAAGDLHASGLDTIPLVPTPLGLLDSIERSTTIFDELAARLSESYRPDRQPILDLATRARRALSDD